MANTWKPLSTKMVKKPSFWITQRSVVSIEQTLFLNYQLGIVGARDIHGAVTAFVVFITILWYFVQFGSNASCSTQNCRNVMQVMQILAKCSWPSSPPHWLSQKRNQACVKLPSPFYFINHTWLYQPGGLMDRMSISLSGFPQVVAISEFDSCSMYSFCEALTSLF